mmetsp:Transcript_37529/g.93289  ORF Transcript_37529/g.93289 Transcript_37529/m.93289 type:complete len:231 (+) Transcript_37529:1015-1707(+)
MLVHTHVKVAVVEPFVRKANLDAKAVHLFECLCTCGLRHPRHLMQTRLQRKPHLAYDVQRACLRLGSEMLRHVQLPYRLPHGALHHAHRPLPPRLLRLLPGQRLCKEFKVRVDECLGQVRRAGVRRVPAQVCAQLHRWCVLEEAAGDSERHRVVAVERLGHLAGSQLEEARPFNGSLAQRRNLLHAHLVVGRVRVALLRARQMRRSESSLELEHGQRARLRLRRRVTKQL